MVVGRKAVNVCGLTFSVVLSHSPAQQHHISFTSRETMSHLGTYHFSCDAIATLEESFTTQEHIYNALHSQQSAIISISASAMGWVCLKWLQNVSGLKPVNI